MNNFKKGWFVIYTKPRHEKKVSEQLHKADVSAFLPMMKTLNTWCDRKKYVEMPVFPSYVFVKLPDNQSYYQTLQIHAMLYYLRTGNELATVSETVISTVKMLLRQPQPIEVGY